MPEAIITTAVKQALRVSTTILDTEINDIIDACKLDLSIAGIITIVDTDALIKRAIIIYAKSHFGVDNADSEKYMASYKSLRDHLAMCGDYSDEIV